ncbi:uncharacterized protein LOC114931028, partial [Nylanderia fulva]|uniref:uncharacterized protein LOC114931028 n=1 Tax=Nylanderia fulva TaxID=613905 RepID=UPI0010FB9AA6
SELRDELWFIEFGRGAALPLTPEEAPADGEPVVPCAQGRVIVETARPAPPHFATCSTYRRPLLSRTSNEVSISDGTIPSSSGTEYSQQELEQQHHRTIKGKGAVSKGMTTTTTPQSPAARPDDLGVTPWYLEDYPTTDGSPGPMGDRSSYPLYSHADGGRPDLNSTRNSSVEGEFPRSAAPVPRRACMDLKAAMELLDETCPNVEPSPSLTPKTPRTPLTPYTSRSKRARSKSSDNSSNYSNDRLSDRSFETLKDKDKDKKRPFLRKIGISKTEDRPFLAKFTPRIIGKPYLEKIGPSRAVERPFLDKIGSSKTLDKFTFDTPRNERRNEVRNERKTNDGLKNHARMKNDIRRHETEEIIATKENIDNTVQKVTLLTSHSEEVQSKPLETSAATFERRRSGKEFLLKMYSFETEDLESTVPAKDDSFVDNALDSGPSSLPTETSDEQTASRPELQTRPTSVTAELLKCRVTTSEEIISSSITCLNSSSDANSWSNSPRRGQRANKRESALIRRRIFQGSCEVVRSDDSTPNSPTKRPISSVSPDREFRNSTLERGMLSPTKTRRSIVEDTSRNTRRSIKYNQFERRGISSDNLLAKDALSFVPASRTITDDIGRTREISSEDSLATRRNEYTKETFKQLQEKFRLQEIPMESYASFLRRTRASQGALSRHERLNLLPAESDIILKSSFGSRDIAKEFDAKTIEIAEEKRDLSREGTVRSILRKQEGIDQPDHESDTNASIRRPKRRIFHEPSQETMDLLTELRKVKSLLKTPSWEKDLDLDQKPTRMPKRILLTDKEFCLSVERENSVRRPSKMINSLETTEEGKVTLNRENKEEKENRSNKETKVDRKPPGLALFEKRCMSLDYADEEKPQKPEARAISLASTRDLPFEVEESDYPDLIYDSKSCSSDVFNSPSDEVDRKVDELISETEEPKKPNQNHCVEVDIAIPIDRRINSPKGEDVQERTSDLYEIISPRSTPFRVKKRLGKISVEETVKPENFTLGSKVDCRSVVAQKRTKCVPL